MENLPKELLTLPDDFELAEEPMKIKFKSLRILKKISVSWKQI